MIEVQELTDKRLTLKINNRLTARLHNVEQHSQYDALDIHGVLELPNENICTIVYKGNNKIFTTLQLDKMLL